MSQCDNDKLYWFDRGKRAGYDEALEAVYRALRLRELIEACIDEHVRAHHDDD